MQQPPSQHQETLHWRDRLIARSEVINDALEVTKAYAARFAEWVLMMCLIANLVEMFPFFSDWFRDVVLVVQAITLDIAGFGLTMMGSHARRCGDERTARTAGRMGWTQITLMILTAALVTLSVLIPETKPVVDGIEKALILARIVVTVLYGHVVHSLRQAGIVYADELSTLRQHLPALQQEVSTLRMQVNSGQQSVDALREQLESKHHEVFILQQQLESATHTVDTLTAQVSRSEKQVSDLTSQLQHVTSGQQEVSPKRSQVTHHRSEEVTSKEVNQRSQAAVLQLVLKPESRRGKHDPREVKAWCEAHADLSQAEQAAQLGISDAANLRRLLRRARDLEERGQVAAGE